MTSRGSRPVRPSCVSPRARLLAVVSLCVLVPLGFGTKFYRGPAAEWIAGSLGGALYEIFWCLAAFLACPRVSRTKIAVVVLGVTSVLEVLQLWHTPLLESVRSTFLGASLIGTTFVPLDFAYYVLGCAVGWAWIGWLRNR